MKEIMIYDDIGPSLWADGVTDNKIKQELDSVAEGEDIVVRINSGGGDVFHGFAIYNMLKQHDSHVTVRVDGIAASAASTIAMAGDRIEMSEASMLMIHDPWTLAIGDADEMLKTADRLEKVKESILTSYARTGIDRDEISEMMTTETWMTAEEAIEKGFADAIVETKAKISNLERPWINNCPIKEVTVEDSEEEILAEDKPLYPKRKIAAKLRLAGMA